MKIGMFGGSFDPVHLGHLWIGEAATEQLGLDRLHWIPSATQPLKPGGAIASNQERLEMLQLAIAGREGHVADDRELKRGGVSYTLETVDSLGEDYDDCELYLIIGSDSLASMPRWHQPEKLLSRVVLSVVQRGGDPPIDFGILEGIANEERTKLFRQSVIRMPVIELSSSEIRSRAGQGSSVRHRVPRAVEAYLCANSLYQSLGE
ncbi:MAG: nicotinate (nicotinamide) nucleotide adenylyltransferase [Planctomycetota bacterium]